MAKNDVSYICLRAGFVYVFILYRFDEFLWISEWITETQPRTRIFSYEEKTAVIASAKLNFFLYLGTHLILFSFFIFPFFIFTETNTAIWRFFFLLVRRIFAWIHEARFWTSVFGAKTGFELFLGWGGCHKFLFLANQTP